MNPVKFSDLKLMPSLLKAVEEEGYTAPSPIQEKAIPPVLEGRDLVGCAQTGTGKTAAFALPILQRLTKNPIRRIDGQPLRTPRPIRALILTPTRELALQIQESFDAYGRHTHLRSAVIFGGVSQVPQVETLQRGVDILVATPGRLNDLIGQGHVHLKNLEIFVLDEADRMLDMGFVHDVKKVISQLPARRQSLLFSATMPDEIARLADTLLQDPAIRSALIFTRTKHGADRVVRDLGRAGVQALAIHGNKSQNARQNALGSFKNGSIRVLVATDIAARGIDVEELSHVINYDLPNIPETYVHRIGRTGRAGLSGVAVSFCDFEEKAYLKDIEKLIRKPVPVVEGHPYPMQVFEIPPKPERPPRQNSRPGQGPKADARNAVRPGPHKQAAKQPDSKEENKSRGTGRVQNVPGTVRKNTADTASPPSVSGGKRPKGRKEKTPPSPSAPAPAPSRPETASPSGGAPRKAAAQRPGLEPAITKKPRPIRPFQSRSAGVQRDFLPKDEKK